MKRKPEKGAINVLSRRDMALLLMILCASGLLFMLSGLFSAGDEVVITVGAQEYGRYSLYEQRTVVIERDGMRNIVEISGGRVHMKSANCSDLLCVKQVYIDSGMYSIVCLPNQVVVEVSAHE